MFKKVIFTVLLCFSFGLQAKDSVVYVGGDIQSRTLAMMLFPDKTTVPQAGGDGVLLWRSLLETQNSVAITVTDSVHISPLVSNREDFAKHGKLLAILSKSSFGLVAKNGSDFKSLDDLKKAKRPITVANISVNGICQILLEKLKSKHDFNFINVGYKNPSQAKIDLLGGHVDLHCTGGASLTAYIAEGHTELINFEQTYGAVAYTYLYANPEMSIEDQNKIVSDVNKNLSIENKVKLNNMGVNWHPVTGYDAENLFKKQRYFWETMIKKDKK